jgi:hypothetical protein
MLLIQLMPVTRHDVLLQVFIQEQVLQTVQQRPASAERDCAHDRSGPSVGPYACLCVMPCRGNFKTIDHVRVLK